MSSVNLQLPNWLAREVRRLADEDRVTIDQFVTVALAEKLSALKTVEYLRERGKRGDRAKYLAVLAKAADVEPEPYDRLE